jgi:outer membrane protein assembly factor BamB
MKKVLRAIIFLLLQQNLQLYAGESDRTVTQSFPIQLKPIDLQAAYLKAFDEQIVDVIFDTATVSIEEAVQMGWKEDALTAREDDRVPIHLPILAIISKRDVYGLGAYYVSEKKRSGIEITQVIFYDSDVNIHSKLELRGAKEKIFLSPNSKYLLLSTRPADYDYSSGGVLYYINGKKIWETNMHAPSPIAISDEGYTISAYLSSEGPSPGGDFCVYDPEGQLITTITNPDKTKFAPIFAEFADDGNYAVLCFQVEGPPTTFMFINKEGEVLWEKRFPDYRFSGFEEEIAVTSAGVIGITIYPRVFHIDQNGNVKWTLPLEARGFMTVRIGENGEKVYIISSKGFVWCIDIDAGKILWKHREPWSPEPTNKISPPDVPHFGELRVSENRLFVIGKKGIPWHSSTLFIFDAATGKVLATAEFPQEKITFAQIDKDVALVNITNRTVMILRQEVLR